VIMRREFAAAAADFFASRCLLTDQNPRGVFSSAKGLRNFASANCRTALACELRGSARLLFWLSPGLKVEPAPKCGALAPV